jgi:hypothetical protein
MPYWPWIGPQNKKPRTGAQAANRRSVEERGHHYHVTLNITGDVNAGVSLFNKDSSAVPSPNTGTSTAPAPTLEL